MTEYDYGLIEVSEETRPRFLACGVRTYVDPQPFYRTYEPTVEQMEHYSALGLLFIPSEVLDQKDELCRMPYSDELAAKIRKLFGDAYTQALSRSS